ncbi:unnamed protein product [Leptosia nina]|uniref:Uncharacterized protein n=1 Tax=Leptosia nina TaxID=320188 RepID=A0AAV1K166_9NEOP
MDSGVKQLEKLASSLLRLQSIYENLKPGSKSFHVTHVKRVSKAVEVIDFLAELEASDRWSYKYIVLDSSTEIAKDTVIKHARSFKLGRRTYHYLLSGFVMDDHWSENTHEFETLNITGFRVLDYSTKKVKDFLEIWQYGSHISSKAAMMFDSVNLLIEAILRMGRKKSDFLRAAYRRSYSNSTKNTDCNIEERGITPFEFGEKLAKMIRKTEIDGLTGFIKFDDDGRRRNFSLRVVEMTTGTNAETIGTWYDDTGLSTLNELGWVGSVDRNKTYIITSIVEEPYIMPILDYNSNKKKHKGFCVDLAELIMDKLKLKYELRIVKDGKYGGENIDAESGWDGIVGELMRREADLSISSLSVTVYREQVIDFSKTFLSFDTVPEDVPISTESIFSFLLPLSKEIWFCILGSFFAVSICLYIVSKYCPNEYQLRVRTSGNRQTSRIKIPQAKLENTFSLWTAIWFALGSFMQQSSGYSPRSLSGRIVSGVWWFVALFVIVIYTANLTTHLTIAQLNPPLNPIHRISKCPAETNKPCEMLISVMETGLKDFAVAFPKGSPLREGVNLALQKLRNEGALYRLIRTWFMPSSCTNKNHGKEMTLSQIAGLFYILVGGLVLGLIIGFIEYMVYRHKSQEGSGDVSPPGTPIRTPTSPMMRKSQRTLSERDAIDWNAVNFTGYDSPRVQQRQEETAMQGTFGQV